MKILLIGLGVFFVILCLVILLVKKLSKNKKNKNKLDVIQMDYEQPGEISLLQEMNEVPLSNVDDQTKDKVYDFTNPEEYNYRQATKQQTINHPVDNQLNNHSSNEEQTLNSVLPKGNHFEIPDQFVTSNQNIYEERSFKDCPKCGNKVDSKSEYCFLCGHKFE